MRLYAVFTVTISAILIVRASDAQQEEALVSGPPPTGAPATTDTTTITIRSTIDSSLTWRNPIFQDYYYSRRLHYDVFKVVASIAGVYTFSSEASFATNGYLYRSSFNGTANTQNLINYAYSWGAQEQFLFSSYLDTGVAYYLVVAPPRVLEGGQYRAIVRGPAQVTLKRTTVLEPSRPSITIQSNFSNILPHYESFCSSSTYYPYEIFSIIAEQNGNYTIEIAFEGSITTQLHSPSFDPAEPIFNIVARDRSDGFSGIKLMSVNLIALQQYYLVLSPDYLYSSQRYRVIARGPSKPNMTKLTDSFVSTVKRSFSLSKKSPRFSQNYPSNYLFYYELFHVTVPQNGIYSLVAYSNITLKSYFYQDSFWPNSFYQNQIASGYYGGPGSESSMKAKLTSDTSYYLVVTTEDPSVTGAGNFTIAGQKAVTLSVVSGSPTFNVTVSVSLTPKSPRFTRCQDYYYGSYHYRLFKITVPRLGIYTVESKGSLDTFGCLYVNQFYSTSSSSNLLAYDDQSGYSDQFLISLMLNNGTVYYLAATTNREESVGSYKVAVSGPAKAKIREVEDI